MESGGLTVCGVEESRGWMVLGGTRLSWASVLGVLCALVVLGSRLDNSWQKRRAFNFGWGVHAFEWRNNGCGWKV